MNKVDATDNILQRRHLVYSCATLGFLTLFLLAPLIAITTNFYVKHSNYIYDAIIDYKSKLEGQSTDILFYGDSTALHNVVPDAIEKTAGFHAYNLGFSLAVMAGAPDLMLDRYLAHNKKPAVLVLYLGPTSGVHGYDLDYTHFYEGAMALERYAPFPDALRFYLANPRRAFGVAAVVFRNLLSPPEPNAAVYTSVVNTLRAEAGWIPTPDVFHGAGMLVELPNQARPQLQADASYITEFRQKYEALGIRVLVYVSPVAACSDLTIAEVKAAYGSLADNEPYSFPCDTFRGGFHLEAKTAEQNSVLIARFLQRELASASSAER